MQHAMQKLKQKSETRQSELKVERGSRPMSDSLMPAADWLQHTSAINIGKLFFLASCCVFILSFIDLFLDFFSCNQTCSALILCLVFPMIFRFVVL